MVIWSEVLQALEAQTRAIEAQTNAVRELIREINAEKASYSHTDSR